MSWHAGRLHLLAWSIALAACAPAIAQGVAPHAVPPTNHREIVQTAYADLPLDTANSTPASNPTPTTTPAAIPSGPMYVPVTAPPPAGTIFAPPRSSLPPSASPAGEVYIPPANAVPPTPTLAPGQVIYAEPPDWMCEPVIRERRDHWYGSAEVIVTQANINSGEFGSWPNEQAAAGRFTLGVESMNGVGIRGRFWGFDQDVEAYSEDAGIRATSFQLDVYKRFAVEEGNLAIGAGSVFGTLNLSGENSDSEYQGGGLSLFADFYYPGIRRGKLEVGIVARGRISITNGDWDDTSGGTIVPETDHDTMRITEIGFGPELRWCFGRNLNHTLVLSSLVEHQQWESEWMSSFTGSSVDFSGVSFSLGVEW